MNLKDLARLINECNDGVEQINEIVTITLPALKTRLEENIKSCSAVLNEEQVVQMKLALNLANNSIDYREQEVKKIDSRIEYLEVTKDVDVLDVAFAEVEKV